MEIETLERLQKRVGIIKNILDVKSMGVIDNSLTK